MTEKLTNQNVFVDGAGVGDIGPAVMREREVLARDGFVIAVVPVSAATGELSRARSWCRAASCTCGRARS